MGPSQAMGTFLRIWRSEWAGLSRAQLAIALHGVSSRAKGVTPRVIRRWEEGQPPGTVAELDALTEVMGRHGLVQWEVDDFRQAVFAACVDRQYPGMLATEDFAFRDDVEEVASQDGPWFDRSIIDLVVCLESLERAVLIDPQQGIPRAHRRRQETALALLLRQLAIRHGNAERHGHAAALNLRTLDFVEQRFDDAGWVLRLRACIAGSSRHAMYGRGGWPRSACRQYAMEVYRYAEEAWALGSRHAGGYGEAVGSYPDNEDLVQKAEQRLEDSRQAIGKTNVMVSHTLVAVHSGAGRNARAEEHLAEMMRLPVKNPYGQVIRDHSQACIALRAYGSLDEAERLFSQCLEDCIRHRYMWFVGMLRGQLAECRRRQETAPRRRGRPKS